MWRKNFVSISTIIRADETGKDAMKRVLTATLVAMSVCLSASACGGKQEAEFGIPDQQAIRSVTSALETSFNAKDVDKLLTLYTENSVYMPPNKPLLRGRDSLKQFYDGLLNGGSKDLKITPADVSGHGTLAYESGSYSMTNGTVPDRGKYLFIFRKHERVLEDRVHELEQRPAALLGLRCRRRLHILQRRRLHVLGLRRFEGSRRVTLVVAELGRPGGRPACGQQTPDSSTDDGDDRAEPVGDEPASSSPS
jgi:ketosteroid isomerase-like protein